MAAGTITPRPLSLAGRGGVGRARCDGRAGARLYWRFGGDDRSGGGAALQGDELARRIVDSLVDRQAEDVVLLDLTGLAAFADYFVIATATSERQIGALVDAVVDGAPGQRARREGGADGGWVLVEVGSVVAHLFSREQRVYYDLEGLWQRAHEVVRVQ